MQLEPFPYHLAVCSRLERIEPDLWQWFQSEHAGNHYRQVTLEDLQQRASRLPRNGANERPYALAETARDRMGAREPVALFHLREPAETPRSFLVFMPGEVLIAFAGDMLDRLQDDAELIAATGREIARFQLYQAHEDRIHGAACMLRWLMRQEGCPPEIAETWRRFELMTTAYCDLGGFIASDNRAVAMSVLFTDRPKPGAAEVESLLQLADSTSTEIPDADRTATSSELTARALALARATSPGAREPHTVAQSLVSGPIDLGSLDLLDQEALGDLTRAILARVLAKPAGGTPRVLAHAREMFPDNMLPAASKPIELPPRALASSAIDYLAYLLLDLATAEGTRLRDAIAIAAETADEIGIGTRFREIARQELRGRRGLQAGLARRAA